MKSFKVWAAVAVFSAGYIWFGPKITDQALRATGSVEDLLLFRVHFPEGVTYDSGHNLRITPLDVEEVLGRTVRVDRKVSGRAGDTYGLALYVPANIDPKEVAKRLEQIPGVARVTPPDNEGNRAGN